MLGLRNNLGHNIYIYIYHFYDWLLGKVFKLKKFDEHGNLKMTDIFENELENLKINYFFETWDLV